MSLSPFLVALFTVLALGAQNADRGIRAIDLVVPSSLAMILAAIAWLAAGFVCRERHRRSLLAVGGTLFATCFGYGAEAFGRLSASWVLAVSVLAIPAGWAGVRLVRRRVRESPDLSGLTRFVDVTAGFLLLFAAVPLTWTLARSNVAGAVPRADPDPPPAVSGHGRQAPDIFLIVLDAYGAPSSLREVYGLDVSGFIGALEELGFVVPRNSRANYVSTYLSLASMLDWRYLDDIARRVGEDSRDRSLAYARLHDNATVRWLRRHGYEHVFFRSSYPPLNASADADLQLPQRLANELEVVWARHTVLWPLADLACDVIGCGAAAWPFQPESGAAHEWRFRRLAELRSSERPLFVFAHFLLPHEPFVFDAECRPLEPFWPATIDESNAGRVRRRYALQVRCVNRMVLELATALVSDPGERPRVVLFQADHGYGRFGFGRPPPLEKATPDQIEERLGIFAAYYLPDGGARSIYDSVSPVNVFRIVFGHYFGLDLPLLPDRSYWSSFEEPFRFERIR